MEKQKRWQFYLILAVFVLTLINILPTVFYYTKPLKSPVDETRAHKTALQIVDRVNSLEGEAKAWLYSYTKHLNLRPVSIELKKDDPGLVEVKFKNPQEAKVFRRYLPKAGSLIPFAPAQLELYPGVADDQNTVLVSRKIDLNLAPSSVNNYFLYYTKYQDGEITPQFRQQVYDRTEELALSFAGPSREGLLTQQITQNPASEELNDSIGILAKEIVDISQRFGDQSPVAKRYFSSYSQISAPDKKGMIDKLLTKVGALKKTFETQKASLQNQQVKALAEGALVDTAEEQRLSFITREVDFLEKAEAIIRKNSAVFASSKGPITEKDLRQKLKNSEANVDPKESIQTISFDGRNPFVEGLVIDWSNDRLLTPFYDDIQDIRLSKANTEESSLLRDRMNQLIFNNIARAAQISDEIIAPAGNDFAVALTDLTNAESFLAFNLGFLAEKQAEQTLGNLSSDWKPDHQDLQRGVYPVMDQDSFKKLPAQDQKLGLVVYAPAMHSEEPPQGLKETSIYVIAHGMGNIAQKYREVPNAEGAEAFSSDFDRLSKLLKDKGFIGYPGATPGLDKSFSQDYIFELRDYYTNLLNATRENFYVKGSKQAAVLDFTDVEQRIITLNKIADSEQEDLLKWRDEYNAAQVSMDTSTRFDVPPPTKNIYLENLKVTLGKYFRGDDRKILRWGLDLSGGKTVRIGLRDQNNRSVTNPEDLNTAVNELYSRVNKMGVAERTIRIESENIILDFPGSQAISASELVKASAMYFHIVNEKFAPFNQTLREPTQQFLQGVWNEAVVTNRKDIQSINEIAWERLGGNLQTGETSQPRDEWAKILYENGLRLANPRHEEKSVAFDDTLSTVAMLKGDDYSSWMGQTHPLMVVFNNFALEGSSLTNVQAGYDPSQGNILNFQVKNSYDGKSGSPREDFYDWTSKFAEDRIAGTPKETYTGGRGWRMAVILNDAVVTQPNLRAALREGGMISGQFTQREIAQLASDLKAGSLSFTPKILSEQNVSAELGHDERVRGIGASLIGLFLVAAAMIGFYRFAGVVATCAVLFNLLIMWGVLQNLGAALTLPGIAGIVLTIGMAVDANVLVFERVREEFKISGRIASAIQAGYRKAFSAIVDSNITTIIAAIILIQFDSGPIKGFAVTLIVGLISSMFTALFMTRYFFAGWVQNPKNKSLTMAEVIGNTKIDFLAKTRIAVIVSVIIMVLGGYIFFEQRNTMFGMDFTGGYSLNVELEETPGDDIAYRSLATEALLSNGATTTDFEIRELSRPNQLRIQLGLGMEEAGHPFYGLPMVFKEGDFTYEYEKDPRVVWVVNALASEGLKVQQSDLPNLDQNWSMMSGQFSDAMRNNAIMALSIALLSILVYITIRFEFKFAISAVIALAHDVLITLGIMAMLRSIGLPVQIDLEVIGAIMTIIGYSLNDTIIVFDRIREDLHILRKMKFADIINHALNVTLSRTIMTSGTTLLVLFSLVIFGGPSIFDFSLVMTIGVLVGTFSSLFVAGPVLLYFHNRELSQESGKVAAI